MRRTAWCPDCLGAPGGCGTCGGSGRVKIEREFDPDDFDDGEVIDPQTWGDLCQLRGKE